MDRRRYLAIGGAVLAGIAGCSGDSSEIDDPEATQTNGEDGSGETPESTREATATEQSESADVEFGERELLRDDSGYSTEVYAQVLVENVGTTPAGQTTVNVDWFDGDGNFVEETSSRLPSLEAGNVWVAQVSALTSEPDEIADFEISGDYENSPPVSPSGMQVSQSELEIEEFSDQITGVAQNARDDEIGYVEAHGKIYDGQGRVIGGGWTNASEIPAGDDWAFEIPLTGRAAARAENAVDHEAFLDADSL